MRRVMAVVGICLGLVTVVTSSSSPLESSTVNVAPEAAAATVHLDWRGLADYRGHPPLWAVASEVVAMLAPGAWVEVEDGAALSTALDRVRTGYVTHDEPDVVVVNQAWLESATYEDVVTFAVHEVGHVLSHRVEGRTLDEVAYEWRGIGLIGPYVAMPGVHVPVAEALADCVAVGLLGPEALGGRVGYIASCEPEAAERAVEAVGLDASSFAGCLAVDAVSWPCPRTGTGGTLGPWASSNLLGAR